MTPEEKAKELIKKFIPCTLEDFSDENFERTKQCALICVEEIDKELGYSFLYSDKRRVFYREVKSEIEEQ